MALTRGPGPHFQIILPADHELVVSTSMLTWTPIAAAQAGNPARAGLDLFKAVRAFIGRCSLSVQPADQALFQHTSFLRFDLTDDAWNRILREYVDSELPQLLQDGGVRSLSGFDDTVSKLELANPDNLSLTGPDLLLRDPFDAAVAPIPAGRGRGGGRGAAGPARGAGLQAAPPNVGMVNGPVELTFFNLCTLSLLEDKTSPTSPLLPLARLSGMLGPFSTHEKRRDAISTIQLTGALIRQQLTNRFGCAADGAMAVNLKDFILDTYLPSVFAASQASEEELRREARDSCTYRRSSQGRTDVEISRIPYLKFR